MEKEYQVRYILKNLLSELANSEKPDLTPLNIQKSDSKLSYFQQSCIGVVISVGSFWKARVEIAKFPIVGIWVTEIVTRLLDPVISKYPLALGECLQLV